MAAQSISRPTTASRKNDCRPGAIAKEERNLQGPKDALIRRIKESQSSVKFAFKKIRYSIALAHGVASKKAKAVAAVSCDIPLLSLRSYH